MIPPLEGIIVSEMVRGPGTIEIHPNQPYETQEPIKVSVFSLLVRENNSENFDASYLKTLFLYSRVTSKSQGSYNFSRNSKNQKAYDSSIISS